MPTSDVAKQIKRIQTDYRAVLLHDPTFATFTNKHNIKEASLITNK